MDDDDDDETGVRKTRRKKMKMSLGNNRPVLRSPELPGLRICQAVSWASLVEGSPSSLNCRHEKRGDCRNPQFKLEAYKLQIELANCLAVYLRTPAGSGDGPRLRVNCCAAVWSPRISFIARSYASPFPAPDTTVQMTVLFLT